MGAADKLSAEDRLDIQELFANYVWGLDTGDLDAVVACFAEDGYLEHPPQGKCYGREGIGRLLAELWYARGNSFKGRQHLANHFVITPEGDGARVKAFFSILQFNVDYRRSFVFGIGTWDNFCVQRNGQWLFESVTVHPWLNEDQVPWVGTPEALASEVAAAALA